MAQLITTLGAKAEHELGLILPHEHIFVDLRSLDTPGHGQAVEAEVVAQMRPELERAARAGVSAIVECTPEGVGRRVDLVAAVSRAAGIPVVVPTGIYREPWVRATHPVPG
jgi:phosphotriesterase-related protein